MKIQDQEFKSMPVIADSRFYQRSSISILGSENIPRSCREMRLKSTRSIGVTKIGVARSRNTDGRQ